MKKKYDQTFRRSPKIHTHCYYLESLYKVPLQAYYVWLSKNFCFHFRLHPEPDSQKIRIRNAAGEDSLTSHWKKIEQFYYQLQYRIVVKCITKVRNSIVDHHCDKMWPKNKGFRTSVDSYQSKWMANKVSGWLPRWVDGLQGKWIATRVTGWLLEYVEG